MKLSSLVTTLFAASCLLQVGVLRAKEFKLPNGDFPIASVDIPKDWKPDVIDNGVEAHSDDDTFYLAIVAVGTDKSLQEEIESTDSMLTEHKVKIDESTQKTGKGQVAGFPTESLTATGKDEDGPCRVTILIVRINSKAL